jgi:hypothetical protein
MSKTCGDEGGKTRAGKPCKNPAGYGTEHPGEGRCKFHGGNNWSPCTTGRYAVKARKKFKRNLGKFYAEDLHQVMDLTDELAFLRALLQERIDNLDELGDQAIQSKECDVLRALIDDISKVAVRYARIRSETALTAAEITYLQAILATLIGDYVPKDRQAEFVGELERYLGFDAGHTPPLGPGRQKGAALDSAGGE